MNKRKSVIEVITDANKEHAAALADLRAKLAEEEANKAKADATATEAINSGNADAYTKAKADSRTAADKIEFYKIQIKNAAAKPLFANPADRRAKADEIKKGCEEVKAEKMKKAAQLLKEVKALIEEVKSEITTDNDALEILATNTGDNPAKIDPFTINGLWQRITIALDHIDIKPYV